MNEQVASAHQRVYRQHQLSLLPMCDLTAKKENSCRIFFMQGPNTDCHTSAEHPRNGGVEGEQVGPFRGNQSNEGHYSGYRGGRGRGRGGGRGGWGNRNNAHTSSNWRDDQPSEDQQRMDNVEGNTYRGRGRGRGSWSRGTRRNSNSLRPRGEDGAGVEGEEYQQPQQQLPQSRSEAPVNRYVDSNEDGLYPRPYRARGSGRGGYRQDRDRDHVNQQQQQQPEEGLPEERTRGDERSERVETKHDNAWTRNTEPDVPRETRYTEQPDGEEGGSYRNGYNNRDNYRGGRGGGRGGRGGGRGGNGFRGGDDDLQQPERYYGDFEDNRNRGPRNDGPNNYNECPLPSDAPLPEGFKRRTQRAPHLRKNCRDEREILELFESHHKQKGISLSNYDNIPVDMMPSDIKSVEDFSELSVEHQLAANIERCGYKKPTPVQRFGIPVAISGNDLMACAQTGSGKTAAFLIPVVQYILLNGVSPTRNRVCRPIALVMAPTRELALQIYEEVRKLTFRTDIFYDVVYGGTPYPTRFDNDILVACPGRLKDIFDRNILSFEAIKFLILDEADRMLEMGFEEQIEYLVASRYTDMPTAEDRQTLMFSATFPQRILNLAKRYLRKRYYLLTVGRVGSTTKNITQIAEKVQDAEKMDRLFEILFTHKKTDLVLVFVETKKAAEDLYRELRKEGIPTSTIHGDRRQDDRERALADFKAGVTPILVATDVASRGLDIPDVAHVIQYDLPTEMDDYVHRIGRTARAGNKGTASFFYTRKNSKLCVELAKYLAEHEQSVPGWLKEEADHMEGTAMLQDIGRRRGGGGLMGAGRSRREPAFDDNETWGEGGGRPTRGGHGGGGRHRSGFVDDGGF